MKKLLLSALLTLAMCAPAMAATQETKYFTIDVPDGYVFESQPDEDGGELVAITSNNGTGLLIVNAPRDGAPMADIVKLWEKEMGLKATLAVEIPGEHYDLSGETDGVALSGYMAKEDADYSLVLLIGKDPLLDTAVQNIVWK